MTKVTEVTLFPLYDVYAGFLDITYTPYIVGRVTSVTFPKQRKIDDEQEYQEQAPKT